MTELRHCTPVFLDANGIGVYHSTSMALLRRTNAEKEISPLFAYNSHKFISKGLLTDAREFCMEVEIPALSTCYLVPYTKKKRCLGQFFVSIYPQNKPVEIVALHSLSETHIYIEAEVFIEPGSGSGTRLGFEVSGACDVHILSHQNKVTDLRLIEKGDYLAEDEVMMAVYENNTTLISSTGDASNAREHALTFQSVEATNYLLLLGSPSKPVTGHCPCTVRIYTPKAVHCRFVAIPLETRSSVVPRLPKALSNSVPITSTKYTGVNDSGKSKLKEIRNMTLHASYKSNKPESLHQSYISDITKAKEANYTIT